MVKLQGFIYCGNVEFTAPLSQHEREIGVSYQYASHVLNFEVLARTYDQLVSILQDSYKFAGAELVRVNVRHVSNFLVEQKDEVVESEE